MKDTLLTVPCREVVLISEFDLHKLVVLCTEGVLIIKVLYQRGPTVYSLTNSISSAELLGHFLILVGVYTQIEFQQVDLHLTVVLEQPPTVTLDHFATFSTQYYY